MSGLVTLRWLRKRARDDAEDAFARSLAELRLAEELLGRAGARLETQRRRVAGRAEARLGVTAAGTSIGSASLHARHEARLRGELEALVFGRDVARRELGARSARMDEARRALEHSEVRLAVLERLLGRQAAEARRRRLRSEERVVDDHAATHAGR